MRTLRRFFTRLVTSTMGRRDDERLREEVEEHLALQAAENVRAGLSPTEARRQAVLKFGAVESIREDYRAQKGLPFLETLIQDTRYRTSTCSRRSTRLDSSVPTKLSRRAASNACCSKS